MKTLVVLGSTVSRFSLFTWPGIVSITLMVFFAITGHASATPVIFSATKSAQAGDLIGIQGANFGTNPSVVLTPVSSGGPGAPVTLMAQNSSNAFVSAQIPAGTAYGLFQVQVQDSTGSQSSAAYTNRACVTSFEYPEVELNRQFRLFGRNLVLTGATPTVSFQDTNGGSPIPGTVVSGGTSYVVSVIPPATLTVKDTYWILYSNGFGGSVGQIQAPGTLTIRPGSVTIDPFNLKLPWGNDFTAIAANVYNVKTDTRFTPNAVGDGVTDDTLALQNAISAAAAAPGGTGGEVYLPAGTYKITSGLSLGSKVVIEGAGQGTTTITTAAANGAGITVVGGAMTVGIQNLTMQNTVSPITNPNLVYFIAAGTDTSEMFVDSVTLNGGNWATGGIWMATTTGNRFLVSNCTIGYLRRDGRTLQLKGYGGAPDTTQYVYLRGNTIQNFNIGLQLGSSNTIYENNALNFDGDYYNNYLALQTGTYVQSDVGNQNRLDLSGPNLVVLNNTFTHSGAAFNPQNDGENMLAEDPTGSFFNSTVTGADSTTLSDGTQTWTTNAYANYNVVIVAGTGLGEMGTVASNVGNKLTMTAAWTVTPDTTSQYVLCRLNVPHLLIAGNTIQNKRYVLSLFDGGYDVAIVNNTATNSQDMCLRSLIQPNGAMTSIMYDVLVADNTLTANTVGRPSCIDTEVDEYYNPRFGSAAFLVEVRRNNVNAGTGEAYRTENFYQSAAGQEFNLQGDSSPYGFEGMIYDGNTASNATTAYGWVPGCDGLAIANNTDTNDYRDSFDMSQRDGNSVGTPSWNGSSITMNGSNYLNLSYFFAGQLANWGTLDLPGTMTIEGSFSTAGPVTNEAIISNRPLGDAVVQIDGNGFLSVYGAGFTSGIKSGAKVNDGATHHFAWVSYSSPQGGQPTQILYVDSATPVDNYTNVRAGSIGQGWIGSDTGNTTNFSGTLYGLRVWDVARTATQVAADENLNFAGDEPGLTQLWRFKESSGTVAHNGILSDSLADGLVDYWTFDDDTGTTVTDSIGGNNGTISGTPNWTTGYFGYGLSFDGSTNYVTVPPPGTGAPPWQGLNGLTVHARVKIGTINPVWNYNYRYMLCAVDPANTNAGWYLGTYANSSAPTAVGFTFERGTVGSSPVTVYGTTNLVVNQFYDVTVTYVESTRLISLYVNGTLQATQSNPRALQPSATALIMGMYGPQPTNTAHYLNGVLDDVKIYNRVLSASEVEQLDQQ